MSVCELFTVTSNIGVFHVTDIIGTVDEHPSGLQPRIHVIADVEELWFGDVSNPLDIDLYGGSWNGVWLPPAVSFRVDERVVLFMNNRDPLVDADPLIFREMEPGAFTNGQLFTESGIGLAELREIVTNVRERETCPYPEDFGFAPAATWGPGPDTDEGPAEFGP